MNATFAPPPCASCKLFNASSFGVSQRRPRAILLGTRKDLVGGVRWPEPEGVKPKTVGETLHDLMAALGERGSATSAREHLLRVDTEKRPGAERQIGSVESDPEP